MQRQAQVIHFPGIIQSNEAMLSEINRNSLG
jgi:hypothetical protein